ncbi:two-component system, cell cycle sensor histidine kinase PleC [uncultured Gammaproteobacteria bacterium]
MIRFGLLPSFVICCGVVVMLGLLAVFGVNLDAEYDQAMVTATRTSRTLAGMLDEHVARTAQSVDLTLAALADRLTYQKSLDGGRDPGTHEMLRRIIGESPLLRALVVVDADGKVIVDSASSPVRPYSVAGRGFFAAVRDSRGERMVTDTIERGRYLDGNGSAAQVWHLAMARRLETGGVFAGAVVAVVNPNYLQYIHTPLTEDNGVTVSLFLRDGTLIARSPEAEAAIGRSFADSAPFRDGLDGHERKSLIDRDPIGNRSSILIWHTTSAWPLVALVAMPAETVLAHWRDEAWTNGLIVILVGLTIAGLVTLLVIEVRWRSSLQATLHENLLALSRLNSELDGRVEERTAQLRREIAERRQVETELRKLVRAVEQSPLSVLITDPDGKIEYVNPYFSEVTGYCAEEVIGKNPRLLQSGWTPAAEYRRLWETITSGKVWRGEIYNRTKSGEVYWELASVAPVRGEDGKITHYVAVKENITQRKRAEIELMAAKERAEAASLSKSQFLATVSHELRTPLNAIIGFSDIMAAKLFGPLGDAHYDDYARLILESGHHLLSLVNNILDMAKIEAGKFQIREAVVEVRAVVGLALEMVRARAMAGGLELTFDFPLRLPDLCADEQALRQIMINLLSNAVKFTKPGGRITVRGGISPTGEFVLSVIDTGIGISPEDIETVLEPFGQVDNDLARRYEGTGLGLPLCRSLAEMHEAQLEIESQLGAGTMVSIRFPKERVVVSTAAVV